MSDQPEILASGIDGILVRFARDLSDQANAKALAFRAAVEAAGISGVTEVASSLVSVRVQFDPQVTDRRTAISAIQSILAADFDTAPRAVRHWHIPVAFGPDHAPELAEAAALANITEDQAIHDITNTTVRVIAIGFAPGQPYLGMLPGHWTIPRRTTLTESLPRGALITAVQQLILWAADAPTGWRHIGQTAFDVYRPHAADPFAFSPGDQVSFVQVDDTSMATLLAADDPDGGARCEVSV